MRKRHIAKYLAAMTLNLPLCGQARSEPPAEAGRHQLQALEFARRNDLPNAEAEFCRALAIAPDSPDLLAGLGGILGMEKKFGESTRLLERALRLDPRNLAVRRNLASNQFQ